MEQGPAEIRTVIRGNRRVGLERHDHATRVLYEPIRSKVLEHPQSSVEEPGKGGVDVQRKLPHGTRFNFGLAAHNVSFQGLVYRYDVTKTDDGVGGEEGTFCLCTLWYVCHLFSTPLIPPSFPTPD